MTRTSRSVDLGLLGVAVVWGSSYLAAKSATQAAPIEVVVFGRYAVAAVACLLIAAVLARKRYSPSFTRAELAAGAVLGTTQAAVLALETWGVAGTSASNAGVLISLTLILTPLIEGRLGVSLPAQLWVAAGVCLVGVLLLVGSSASITDPRPGDLLVLLAAVVRAGHVVLIGRVSARASVALRPLQLTTVQVCVGTMWALPFAAGDLVESSHLLTDTRLWVAVGYLALGCSVFAFLAQTWAVQRTSASRASLLLGTEPVWALLVAVLLGGEQPGLLALLGAVLLVSGCWWGQAAERRHREGHLQNSHQLKEPCVQSYLRRPHRLARSAQR